jgi:tRNA threonylcarbamoyladenosine biosynthesis protein TsaE
MSATTTDLLSHSPEETRSVGKRLGALLRPGDVVCLQGELGAGKTTFTQGLAEGWGSLDAVSSPTFIIVNVYRRENGDQLYHLDTYRLDSAPEAEELDIDTMLMHGPLIVEWPERMQSVLPTERLWIKLDYLNDDERQFSFDAHGARAAELLKGMNS